MRSLRGLLPKVSARRTWNADGTTGWEFRFTPRPVPPRPAITAGPTVTARPSEPVILDPEPPGFQVLPARIEPPIIQAVPEPARVVTSRGVQIGADVLRIDEFQHRIEPATLPAREPAGPGFGERGPRPDIAGALVELAADPENVRRHHRVVSRLALTHEWFAHAPGLDIASARISGRGTGRLLAGVFVWRATAVANTFTYVVAPDPATKALLKADLALTRALIRAACPDPEDALGELESSLHDALTRLAAGPGRDTGLGRVTGPGRDTGPGRSGPGRDTGVVLEVDPDPELIEHLDRVRPKSDSERARSEELADLARRVGTASVHPAARASKAG